MVKIKVTETQYQELMDFLTDSFALDSSGQLIPAAEGKNPRSHFFKGREKYYFPKNSNVWAARVLKSSGLSITPLRYQTTGSLLNKAGEFGEWVVKE